MLIAIRVYIRYIRIIFYFISTTIQFDCARKYFLNKQNKFAETLINHA